VSSDRAEPPRATSGAASALMGHSHRKCTRGDARAPTSLGDDTDVSVIPDGELTPQLKNRNIFCFITAQTNKFWQRHTRRHRVGTHLDLTVTIAMSGQDRKIGHLKGVPSTFTAVPGPGFSESRRGRLPWISRERRHTRRYIQEK
jgi:hypothetical protein